MYPWEARKKRKKKLHQLLKDTGIIMVKSRDTSIVLGCFTRKPLKNGKEDLYTKNGDLLHTGVTTDEATALMAKYTDKAKAKGIPTKQYLDDVVEARKLRRSAYKKWIAKFKQKFHKHFDGEIEIRYLEDGVTEANRSMVENGIPYNKRATSSFFPLNWDVTRVKEEVAFVYEQMLKSGKQYNPRATNRKFTHMNSEGTFNIQIEFDELGNFTNAYPKI